MARNVCPKSGFISNQLIAGKSLSIEFVLSGLSHALAEYNVSTG